jgi:Domain of unknown function (DUF4395)
MSGVVDVAVPRFNQLCVAALTGLAFVLQMWVVVPVVAVVLVLTRFGGPRLGLFTQAYLRLVKPRRKGATVTEPADPPRFAQLLGIVFLLGATVLFVVGLGTAGWIVTLMVTALATLAAATRICVGCIIYERAVG